MVAPAIVRGGKVLPHVQAFANGVKAATGVESFGTYNGHDPSIERALDIFVAPASYSADAALGNAVCDYAIEHLDHFGIDYIIFRQAIYNPEVALYWRRMASRGNAVQDHFDHVHISFLRVGSTVIPGELITEEDFLATLSDDEKRILFEQSGQQSQLLEQLYAHLIRPAGAGNEELGFKRIREAILNEMPRNININIKVEGAAELRELVDGLDRLRRNQGNDSE